MILLSCNNVNIFVAYSLKKCYDISIKSVTVHSVLSNLAKYLYSADLFPDGFHFTDFNLRFFITVQTEDSLAAAIVKQSGSCIFSII